jgi:SAM-dependent methyltransferase
MPSAEPIDQTRLPDRSVEHARRSRRHPRPTQFDYLHLRRLLEGLSAALGRVGGAQDVLDVFCGSRPYDDLLPAGVRCVGFDVSNRYGTADVVSDDFLPFPDASFDVVMCIEAFQFVGEPVAAASEIARVLRPGGEVLLSVPLVWEYSRAGLEHRYTATSLTALFTGWDEVRVVETGGRAVAWTTLSASLVRAAEATLSNRTLAPGAVVRLAAATCYLLLNCLGTVLDTIERRLPPGSTALPTGLLLTARVPRNG